MTRGFCVFIAFCFLVASMIGANMTGHPVLAFFLFLTALTLVIWYFATNDRSFRTMTVGEREAQAKRCGGWDYTDDSTFDGPEDN